MYGKYPKGREGYLTLEVRAASVRWALFLILEWLKEQITQYFSSRSAGEAHELSQSRIFPAASSIKLIPPEAKISCLLFRVLLLRAKRCCLPSLSRIEGSDHATLSPGKEFPEIISEVSKPCYNTHIPCTQHFSLCLPQL